MVQREDGSYGVVLKGEDLPEPAQPARAQADALVASALADPNQTVQREDGSYGVVLKGEDFPEPAQPARAQSAQPRKQSK